MTLRIFGFLAGAATAGGGVSASLASRSALRRAVFANKALCSAEYCFDGNAHSPFRVKPRGLVFVRRSRHWNKNPGHKTLHTGSFVFRGT